MNPLIQRLSALVAKSETTKGTAEALIASDGAYNVYDVEFRETTEYVSRNQQGTANKLKGVPGAMMGTCSFRVDLAGSGATGGVPLWATTFLTACGYVNSGGTFTRTLDTSSQTTLTIAHWKNGIKQTLAGASGTFTVTGRNGQPGSVNFNFTGKYMSEADTTQLDPTEPTVLPPRGYETYTLASTDVSAPEVILDAGGQVLMLEGKNDASNTGFLHGVVTDFDAKLTTEPYAVATATFDWRDKFATSAEMALSLVVGDASTNTISMAASKVQLTGGPGFGNRVGAYTRQVQADINDGFTIAFS